MNFNLPIKLSSTVSHFEECANITDMPMSGQLALWRHEDKYVNW